MSERQHIGVGIVVWRDWVLVGERQQGQVLAGKAEFPGGKREPGEAIVATVERECWEETGLAVRVLELLDETAFDYPHGELRLSFFLAELRHDGDATADSPAPPVPRAPFRWVPLASLAQLTFPSANQRALKLLHQRYHCADG